MAEDNTDKALAVRGPSYPFIDLSKAVERVEQITAKGAERVTLAPESYYKFWNYQPKSSNARQTMAAMNAYGLVEYVGRGKDRKVKLSDCARRIVLDKTPNSEARASALKRAALDPTVFHDLWEHFGPHLPHEDVMTSWLVLEREFNQSGAEAAVANFLATVDFANLNAPDNKPEIDDSHDDGGVIEERSAKVGDLVECVLNGQVVHKEPVRVRAVTDDGEWVFIEGSETGIAMSDVNVVESSAVRRGSPKPPPTMPLPMQESKVEAREIRENDIKPLFDFDSVTINTKITSQWHLTQLIARLQQIKPMLPEGAKAEEER